MSHRPTHPTDHTAQSERFPPALDPSTVQLDGRSLATLIARAPAFARLLRFYDLSNTPSGDWSAFFRYDISVLLAEIATVNTTRNHYLFLRLLRTLGGQAEEAAQIQDAIRQMHRVVVETQIPMVMDWQQRAQAMALSSPTAARLHTVLSTVVTETLEPLRAALDISPETAAADVSLSSTLTGKTDMDRAAGRPVARDKMRSLTLAPYLPQIKELRLTALRAAHDGEGARGQKKERQDLLLYFNEMNKALRDLATLAEAYLEESLTREKDHAPHVALWLTFAQLLRHNQDHLNRLPARHLRYYYEGVLKLAPRGPTADLVHVSFVPAPTTTAHPLAAGTRLAAGRDAEGRNVRYETLDALTLTQASVGVLKTLYLPRSGAGKPVERAWTTTLPATTTLPEAPHRAAGWSPFGQAGPEATHPEMGIVLASPALSLAEGERHITLTFHYSTPPPPEDPVATYLSRLQGAYEPGTHRFVEGQSLTLPADAVTIHLSGAAGWIPVEDFSLTIDREACRLVLAFVLDASAPPITENNPDALGERFATQWPLLKLVVNPAARVYAYSLFDSLAIDEATIDVSVHRLRSVEMENENGPIDPSKPFQVFGAVPVQGSYVLFGHPELEHKTPDTVTLTLAWFHLPDDFATYYTAYNEYLGDDVFDDACFAVRFAAWEANRWHPLRTDSAASADSADSARLFQPEQDDEKRLAPTTVFTLAAPPKADTDTPGAAAELVPSKPALKFRFVLSAPTYGFGQELYARVVSHVVTENTVPSQRPALINLGSKKKPAVKEFPNLPFAPMAKAVSLDYTLRHTIRLAEGAAPDPTADQLFLLYPFGQARQQAGRMRLVPSYPDAGHLYLGLDRLVPPQSLSLFFQFSTRQTESVRVSNTGTDQSRRRIEWAVLAEDRWIPLSDTEITLDTTDHFTRSGIVMLMLPAPLTKDNHTMPAGHYWLRATVPFGAEAYSPLQAVLTHATRAVRVLNGAAPPPQGTLPPYTIDALAEKDPAVAEVVQPFPSWGYVPAEKRRTFVTRVSERLRHKQRAVQRWDYERLVLERFPEIGLARCVGYDRATQNYTALRPGEVRMVVVPRQWEAAPYSEPRADATLLREIALYLQAHASHFVRTIYVQNPVYERLKIRASVQFARASEQSAALARLQEEIAQYLVPWWFDVREHLSLGRTVLHIDEVLHFIEQRAYVANVAAFSIEHIYKQQAPSEAASSAVHYALKDSARVGRGATLRATTPWSVLVPLPEHDLVVLEAPTEYAPPLPADLGRQQIGTDFVIVRTQDDVTPATTPTPAPA